MANTSFLLTHLVSFLILMLINSSNSILVRGVYLDCEEQGDQCVDFPTYYVRLFFQVRGATVSQLLRRLSVWYQGRSCFVGQILKTCLKSQLTIAGNLAIFHIQNLIGNQLYLLVKAFCWLVCLQDLAKVSLICCPDAIILPTPPSQQTLLLHYSLTSRFQNFYLARTVLHHIQISISSTSSAGKHLTCQFH